MKAAEVFCRELGFKGAIAPFSTNGNLLAVTNTCIQMINCTGNETSLSYCSLKYSANCKRNANVNASVTCDPSEYFFRYKRRLPLIFLKQELLSFPTFHIRVLRL